MFFFKAVHCPVPKKRTAVEAKTAGQSYCQIIKKSAHVTIEIIQCKLKEFLPLKSKSRFRYSFTFYYGIRLAETTSSILCFNFVSI